MRTSAALAVAAVLVTAACGGRNDTEPAGNPGTTSAEPSAPAFERASAVIEGARDAVRLEVEIAETDAQRERGLMFRESLPQDAGMVFVFAADVDGGFWMKNTLIPLSIAFYDARGRILRILDMEPCRTERCPVYDPGVTYRGALEVNKGAFRRWGVEAGDRIRVER